VASERCFENRTGSPPSPGAEGLTLRYQAVKTIRAIGPGAKSAARSWGFAATDETRANLIRFVYSGRYSADVPQIAPMRVAAAILGRVAR
jgi:hypothetical protein